MDLINFTLSYFATKNIAYITAFICWPGIIQLQRSAQTDGLRVNVVRDFLHEWHWDTTLLSREGILLDIDCPGFKSIIEQASFHHKFSHAYAWLLLDHEPFNATKLQLYLENATILPNADVLWASIDISYDIYRIKEDRSLRLTEFNIQRNSTERNNMIQFWAQLPTTVNRRRNLDQVTLKAGICITQPKEFRGWDDIGTMHIDFISKSCYPLLILLREDLNINYDMVYPLKYGELTNGSQFDGVVGMLQRGEIEVGQPALFKLSRWKVTDYASEAFRFRVGFIFRQPPQSAVTNIFLLPLSRGVWQASALLFLLVAVSMAVLSKCCVRLDPSLAAFTAGETFSFTVGAICQQGFYKLPRFQTIRLVIFVTSLAAMFIFASYTAKILVTLQTPSKAIKTLEDLANSPLKCITQNAPYRMILYSEGPTPATNYLFSHKLKGKSEATFNYSVADGLALVRTGQYACQVELCAGWFVVMKTFTEEEKCGLHYTEPFSLNLLGMLVKKKSGYKQLMASRLRWHREVGLMSRYSRIWNVDMPRCQAGSLNGFVSIGLRDCWPAIQVLLVGCALAAAVLFGEVCLVKIRICRAMNRNPIKQQLQYINHPQFT